ncbi:MAG: hypothetical protein KDJ14_00215 [Xanthomonadales bacterium]|nr:hypothetical protein [Xanthomonadales bacterium]
MISTSRRTVFQGFARISFPLAIYFLLAALQPVNAQGPSVHIGGVVTSQQVSGTWALLVIADGCDAVLTPPVEPQDGGLLEITIAGAAIEVRIGFVADGIVGGCPTPESPFVFTLELGPLRSGTYELNLIGVTTSTGGTDLTDLDRIIFSVPPEARDIPAGSNATLLLLSLMLGISAIRIAQRQLG